MVSTVIREKITIEFQILEKYGEMEKLSIDLTKKYEDIYIILNSIKIMNRDPLIFNVIENYNEGE